MKSPSRSAESFTIWLTTGMKVQTATFDVCLGCPSGSAALMGTGFDPMDDAATEWNETVIPVLPGAVMTLEFHLWDAGGPAGGGSCDSTLLLDGLRFDFLP